MRIAVHKLNLLCTSAPIECERLQTLPDNYTLVTNEKGNENSFMQRYKMLGNGWTVAVIRHIFSSLENTN
jgi:site-specific DNA-cytosine methylase